MTDVQAAIDRVLALSTADGCIVIGQRQTTANLRWANNTVTTSGVSEELSIAIVSIIGRRVASITRSYFPPDRLDAMVRETESACRRNPEAADYMPLVSGEGRPSDWGAAAASTGIDVFQSFTPALGALFGRARGADVQTFGYAEHTASTVWLATSSGLRLRHADRIGKVEITAKTPDFSRSAWTGTATHDFSDVDPAQLFDVLERRLDWSHRRLDLEPGPYEVLLEPSCTADLALSAYSCMTRRDADEGRSPFARPAGGARLGDHLFGHVSMYSDPGEPGIATAPFHLGVESSGATSVFDNGQPIGRTDWVRDGRLQALFTPRYWAARTEGAAPVPYVNNLVVASDSATGDTMSEMIARTERALLITCFWYIRPVDPQTALMTGLTRDGVFLVEHGEVKGAVNNFRWNMSPITAFSHATEIGRTGMALPREHDEFLRAKAPAMRIERFNMSSVSEAV